MPTQKTIAEFISNRSPVCFASSDRVTAAIASMKKDKSDCVFVCDSGAVRGVFTQRDFLNRVAAVGKSDAPLGEVMTKNPAVLREKDTMMTALQRMAVGNYRNIPIVGEGDQAVSNLSGWDVMRYLEGEFGGPLADLGDKSVDALYQRPAVEVQTTEHLLSVLILMVQRSCGAVRVHEGDRLAGIFTEQDLMHRVDYSTTAWHEIPVSEVMTKDPHCIEGGTKVAAALSLMNEKSFRHLPVTALSPDDNYTRLVSIRELLGFVASHSK